LLLCVQLKIMASRLTQFVILIVFVVSSLLLSFRLIGDYEPSEVGLDLPSRFVSFPEIGKAFLYNHSVLQIPNILSSKIIETQQVSHD
jgi:hypothetical protein